MEGLTAMNTLPSPADSTTDPLPPPDTTPYFLRRCAEVDEAVEQEKARRCLLPAA
jgi:hypothetical protein